jgi:putative membrane protein
MILPGISGSFILVMLGMYGPVLAAVTDANIAELGTFVVGAVIGLAIFSQFLNWALKHHHDMVLAGLVGLMGGSLRVLWPWPLGVDSTDLAAPNTDVGLSIVMTIVGFVAVIALSWMARRLDPVLEPSPVPD